LSLGQRENAEQRVALIRTLIIVGILVILSVIAYFSGLGTRVELLRDWFNSMGYWAPLTFIAVYVLSTVAAVPRGVLTMIAGSIFGSLYGIVIVSFSATLGAALAFLVSRYLLRETVQCILSGNRKYENLNQLTEENGGLMVAFTRLTPIFPFNFLNYAFGLTRVDFRTYLFWSWLCMIPWTIVYVVGGETLIRSIEKGTPPSSLIVILIAAGIVILGIGNQIRKKLKGVKDHEIREYPPHA